MNHVAIIFLASALQWDVALSSRMALRQPGQLSAVNQFINLKWNTAVQHSGERVGRDGFVFKFLKQGPLELYHQSFLEAVFDASVAMMLPKVKADVGRHCYTYGQFLAEEFYGEDGSYPDKLKLLNNTNLNGDWQAVPKDQSGRVGPSSFKTFYLEKYMAKLPTLGIRSSYSAYLDKVFIASRMMMLHLPSKFGLGTLGGHCFRYAGLLAGEFYFGGAPLDQLGVVQKPRVDQQTFVVTSTFSRPDPLFDVHAKAVFHAATAMMLPKLKKDVGKHCFSFGVIMVGEFYSHDGSVPDFLGLTSATAPQDVTLRTVYDTMNADWNEVQKNAKDRVVQKDFHDFYMQKFRTTLVDPAEAIAYSAYLDKCFYAGRTMMVALPEKFGLGSLGGHCFRYAGLLAREFYFNGVPGNILSLT